MTKRRALLQRKDHLSLVKRMATLTTPTLTTTTSGGAHARCGRRMMRVSRVTNALQGVSSTRKIPNDTSALKSRNYSLSSSLVAKATTTTTTSTPTTTVFRSWERRRQQQQHQKRGTMVKTAAGGGQGDAPKKITRANEAKTEAFLSPEEKAGTNPLKDPMAIIGIVGIVGVPALILLIGVTSGYIGQ